MDYFLFAFRPQRKLLEHNYQTQHQIGQKENVVGLDISQITFVNWNAGGNNSVSGLLKGQFVRTYTNKNLVWKNELIARYGINKQEKQDVKKQTINFN